MDLSRFLLAAVFALTTVPFVHAQDRDRDDRYRNHDWDRARQVVNRAMEDLRSVERRDAFAGEDRERYDRSLRSGAWSAVLQAPAREGGVIGAGFFSAQVLRKS